MPTEQIVVRNVDSDLWKLVRGEAARQSKPIGSLLNDIFRAWIGPLAQEVLCPREGCTESITVVPVMQQIARVSPPFQASFPTAVVVSQTCQHELTMEERDMLFTRG